MFSCSKDEDMRMPENIIGIWSPSDSRYLEFGNDYTVHNLEIEYQDGESIGIWNNDAYLYEPGYHIVIYMSGTKADVYQIIELNETYMTWCWVEDIEAESAESIGAIIGQIINQAQAGFKLDPDLYQSFTRIPKDKFLDILLKIMFLKNYP